MWVSSGLGGQGLVLPVFEQTRHLTVRIVKVSKIHAMRRANRNTCGFLSFFQTVMAEGALVDISLGMLKSGIIRTGLDAGPASYTFVWCDQDESTFDDMTGSSRAAPDACSIFTVVATF